MERFSVRCPGCGAEVPVEPPKLSVVERDVLAMMAEGLTCKEVAKRRGRSESTVKHQVQHLRERLGAGNVAQAVAMAANLGLLEARG